MSYTENEIILLRTVEDEMKERMKLLIGLMNKGIPNEILAIIMIDKTITDIYEYLSWYLTWFQMVNFFTKEKLF